MEISADLLQRLVDAAYSLALVVHYEDVPQVEAEMPLIEVLREVRQTLGRKPTNYGTDIDWELLLG
ncbi:MAG: hypothetical protein H0U76_22210 [Ktedonobacteraceae bacterium]|nr:hypothetical protein [Ktedonobacteraceae bacterium]